MENVNVIDYGCGNLMWSLGLFPKAKSITGIEISNKCLTYSEINARKANIDFIPILVKDNDDISIKKIPDYNFDIAIVFALIELLNLAELREVFVNIYDKLKINGYLICSLHPYRIFSALCLPSVLSMICRGKYNFYQNFCERHGFQPIRIRLNRVASIFEDVGFSLIAKGGINPYIIHERLIKFKPVLFCLRNRLFYQMGNYLFAHWANTQYLVLKK